MNRLTLVGRIVREVECKEIGEDKQVLNNVLAVPKKFAPKDQPEADFINFVAWNKRAQLICDYCKKGDLIGLDGYLSTRSYEDKEGRRQFVCEQIVEELTLLPNER